MFQSTVNPPETKNNFYGINISDNTGIRVRTAVNPNPEFLCFAMCKEASIRTSRSAFRRCNLLGLIGSFRVDLWYICSRNPRQFSEIKYNRTVGRYTFEGFDRLVKERGMVSEFSPYEFKMEKE